MLLRRGFVVLFILSIPMFAEVRKTPRLNSLEQVQSRFWYQYLEQKTPEIAPPQIISEKLESAATVHRLKPGTIPQTQISLLFSGGEMEESKENSGITSLWANLLVFSGSESIPRDELSRVLEHRASVLNAGSELQQAVFSLSSLSYNFSADLEILEDLFLNPRFAEDDLAIMKAQILQGMKRRSENPARALSLTAKTVLFPGGPRGLVPSLESIQSLRRADIITWHKKMVCSKRLNILLDGAYSEETLQRIKALAENLNTACSAPDKNLLQAKLSPPEHSLYHLDMDIPQGTLIYYAAGVTHDSPKYFSWRLYNYILGGSSFNSVMTRRIRTEMGFAYSAYSTFSSDAFIGRSILFTQTANETIEPVQAIIDELLSSPEEYITEDALALAKISLVNKLVFLYETPGQYLKLWYDLRLDGLDEVYLQQLPARLMAVSKEEVLDFAREYYKKDLFYVFLAAPKSAIKDNTAYSIFVP